MLNAPYMYWASTTVIGRLECTTKFSPSLVKILNEVYSLVHLSRIACLTFLTGTFLGFEILFAKLLIMNYCFLFLCHFTVAGMEGVEPSLSMMYFYGVAYTKAFSLQALATELRSPSRASTRSTVSTACEASPFRLKVRKAPISFPGHQSFSIVILDQSVKETSHAWTKSLQLFLEEFLLRAPHLLTLPRMHVKRVWRYGNGIHPHIVDPSLDINIPSVINEVLQMVGIPALCALAEKYHALAHKYAPLWLIRFLVHQLMPLPQSLNLFCDDAPAVLCADGEQALPYIVTVAGLPQFQCKVPGNSGVASPYCLLHGRGHLEEVISVSCPDNHFSSLLFICKFRDFRQDGETETSPFLRLNFC